MSKNSDFSSRIQSIRIALDGLKQVLRTEPNTSIHALFTLAVFSAALIFKLDRTEWALLILTVGFVWAAEVFNTAVEKLVDLASPEFHDTAKTVKDISAGAVLVSVLAAIGVGALLFGPPLIRWFAESALFNR